MSEKPVTIREAFRVQGLDCAEEVDILGKELGHRSGIVSLQFDIVNARMDVTYDPQRVGRNAIVAAVASTGMKAIPWEEKVEKKEVPFWLLHGHLVMTCASGATLVAGFISHWLAHGNLLHALTAGGGEEQVFPLTSILFYISSTVTGGWFVVPRALRAARRLRPDMNLLMTVAIMGAMAIGQWLEAGAVAFLFSLALLLERWSVGRARRAISALMEVSPAMARCASPDDAQMVERKVEEVPVGARVLVRPGERIPLDGEVISGSSAVNQAPITGESQPVSKGPGDEVFAGTINEDGVLEFRVTKPARDTTLAHVIHLVQEAHARRAPSERWVDTFARYYTPTVIFLAVAAVLVPPLVFSGTWGEWFYRGLVMLVIACPCALVISTPVSIVCGLTAAARNGVLIKGGMFLEAPSRLQVLALDKTGTLTYGRPEVEEVIPFDGHTREEILERAATLEAHSEHPFARAIVRRAEAEGISLTRSAENFQSLKGKGARADIDGRSFWIGSHRLVHEIGSESPEVHARAEQLQRDGRSVVAVGSERHVCALIAMADRVREEAREIVEAVKKLGIKRVVMLTGDNQGTARTVAESTGVDSFTAELLPEEKVGAVQSLADEFGAVAMVGDGVNDAPAMAAAAFGIAMGAAGTDAAIETADIALMSDDLTKLPWLITYSRRTLRIVRHNIVFALGAKVLFMVLAVLGLATLWMAIAADMGASLLVITNGMRLLGRRPPG